MGLLVDMVPCGRSQRVRKSVRSVRASERAELGHLLLANSFDLGRA